MQVGGGRAREREKERERDQVPHPVIAAVERERGQRVTPDLSGYRQS